MNNGYVKIYRMLTEKGFYKKSEFVHLWLHLIMKATYMDKEYMFNNQTLHLKAGQFITGRNSLAKETGINRSKIERILKCFENGQQIEQQTNNKFRIITILNWNKYQQDEPQNEQPLSNKRASREQRVSINNKNKNNNKDKNNKKELIPTTIPKTNQNREDQILKRTPEDEKRGLEHISIIMQKLNSDNESTKGLENKS